MLQCPWQTHCHKGMYPSASDTAHHGNIPSRALIWADCTATKKVIFHKYFTVLKPTDLFFYVFFPVINFRYGYWRLISLLFRNQQTSKKFPNSDTLQLQHWHGLSELLLVRWNKHEQDTHESLRMETPEGRTQSRALQKGWDHTRLPVFKHSYISTSIYKLHFSEGLPAIPCRKLNLLF